MKRKLMPVAGTMSREELAARAGRVYEFLYRQWSNDVHAGAALDAIGRKGGTTVIRPVRHPETLQTCVTFAGTFSLMLARAVVGFYASEKLGEFRSHYLNTIQSRLRELTTKQVITAPWKDTLSHGPAGS